MVGLRPQLSVQHVSAQSVEQAGQEGVIDAADQLGCLRRQRMERAVAQLHLGGGPPGRVEPMLRENRLRDGKRALGAKPAGPEPVPLGGAEILPALPGGADGRLPGCFAG